nr:D-Ala-D-Ala carboxypeptidase family metallohydrolase [uncultured Dysosmobacter sp.]
MTRAGTIPLSQIARIQIYAKPVRNNKSGMQRVLQETGGSFCMNGPIFLRSLKACCHLKADGKVLCAPNYGAWAISWNTPADFGVKKVPNGDGSWAECVHLIVGGQKISPIHCGGDMRYACNRTAVGVKEGRFAYYATETNYTPEQLRDVLAAAGWSDAIMMDGGGSTCFLDREGQGFAGDGRTIPFWLVVTLREDQETDNEPEGEKPPMVTIQSYSRSQDGEKRLTRHFKVKEFACSDGSDPVFIARALPLVLEYIRTRVGKPVVINSAYRTPGKNQAVGGAVHSQHLYGTAADLGTVAGYTPAEMAAIAREIMPDWGGIGVYPWGIHVDVREKKADWKG